jgi:hypothetical protein
MVYSGFKSALDSLATVLIHLSYLSKNIAQPNFTAAGPTRRGRQTHKGKRKLYP